MKIPVVVCEFHQEVLQYIHRLIARKKLPFNGIKMVHLDSHPDLAFPDRLSADDCFSKEKMYYDLDIADWILPLMYAGHIDYLVWVKPPWADQIPDKLASFAVGKERETGYLRVTCAEDYFLEDCTYAVRSKLDNVKDVTLDSIELKSLLSKIINKSPNVAFFKHIIDSSTSVINSEQIAVSTDSGTSKKIKLDPNINLMDEKPPLADDKPSVTCENQELDSVQDIPVRNSSVEDNIPLETGKEEKSNSIQKEPDEKWHFLDNTSLKTCSQQKLDVKDRTTITRTSSYISSEKYILDIDLDFFSVINPFLQDYTEEQYKELQKAYAITLPSCKDDESVLETCVRNARMRLQELKNIIDSVCKGTTPVVNENDTSFVKFLVSLKNEKEDIDWEMLHNAGMTTLLPHHISTEAEIDELVEQLVMLLKALPVPSAITIARSTVDEYAPPNQIEMIQEKVLNALKVVYSDDCLDINYDYNDESRLL